MGCRRGRRSAPLNRASPLRRVLGDPRKRRSTPLGRRGAFVFSLFLLTGCGAVASDITPEPPAETQLTIGFPEASPGTAEIGLDQVRTILSVEELTLLTPDGRALPLLAESWDWENNDLRLRITLRDGVTFHDGTPLTGSIATQVLLDAIKRPGNLIQYPSLADIRDIQPDGDRRVVIDLFRPSAFLPTDLAVPFRIGPNRLGTGPHRVVRSTASELVLERYDGYYGGTPSISRIVVRPFTTLRTAWTSLLRGEVDMVTEVPPDAIEFIQNDSVQVVSFPRRYQFLLAFNARRGPFRFPAVRRALNLAVDREALIRRVLNETGAPSTGPIWPQFWAYDSSVAPYGFDPAVARSLLDQAGFPAATSDSQGRPGTRFQFTCLIPANFAVWERIALEVQKSLYDIGVDMQFQVVPIEEFDTVMREGRFEAAIIDMISGPTPMRPYIFWRSAREVRGLNTFGYENAEAERLFDILRETRNEAAVRTATRRLQRVFLEDPPALFLAWNDRTRAIRREFVIPSEPGRDPMFTLSRWTTPGTPSPTSR